MNIWYFKEQIPDELHGAKDYIKRAIEIRAMHSEWGKRLADMSEAELEHAETLYRMFQEYYAKLSGTYEKMPEYCEEAKKCIDEEYVKCSVEIRTLHEIYKQ